MGLLFGGQTSKVGYITDIYEPVYGLFISYETIGPT